MVQELLEQIKRCEELVISKARITPSFLGAELSGEDCDTSPMTEGGPLQHLPPRVTGVLLRVLMEGTNYEKETRGRTQKFNVLTKFCRRVPCFRGLNRGCFWTLILV